MEEFKEELMMLGGALLTFLVGYMKNRIRVKLQEELDLRTKIDNAVLDAEETGQAGVVKKEFAKLSVKQQLKNEGISIGKRIAVNLLGGLGKSIDRSVFNQLNNGKK